MAGLWQRTGTATVTNGSKTVTGSGTKWKTGTLPIQKGHTFYGPDNWAYEVDTVVSDTEILLVENYRGGTLANQAYRIDITRTSTISQFAADLASLVGKYRSWFDGMMTWLTGSGDVAILNPDTGANVTIPSWKKVASEGEGQAARAKTEAGKAAASAALAGDIVVASALPLPDVWAPLSDSLRMITGYGREVKVGEDVVGQMVNFSRSTTATYIGKDGQLKTAAANEPRFEKEGLLIEGQSSNLIPWSRGADYSKNPSYFLTGASAVTDGDALVVTATAANGGVGGVLSGSHEGKTTTVSLWAKGAVGGERLRVGLSIDQLAMPFDVVLTTEWVRYSKTYSIDASNTSQTSIRIYAQNPCTFSIDKVQCELLPFASSYIPTNGAAVTRAADVCFIPERQNIYSGGDSVSFCCEVDTKGGLNRIFEAGDATLFTLSDTTFAGRVSRLAIKPIANSYVQGSRAIVAASISPARVTSRLNGIVVSGVPSIEGATDVARLQFGNRSTSLDRPLNGHIRNFRIWHSALTDEQIKALK